MNLRLKIALAVIAVAMLLGAARLGSLQERLRTMLQWIEGLGAWGALVFVLLYIAACVLFIPGWLLTLGAGIMFGVARGTVLVSAASTLGATAAFLVGRHLARDWVSRRIEGHPRFKAIDEAVAREGWKIVGLTRLSPVFPFTLLNYGFGLTRVSLRDYFFASWIGMLPGTVVYVYAGSLIGDLSSLGNAERTKSPSEWTFYLLGLLVTAAVTIYVTRLAKKALAERIDASNRQQR